MKIPRPRKDKYKVVIVSPPLDDAVFSCGGLIAQNPDQCLVINVFTEFQKINSNSFVASGSHRKDEEAMASDLLKYDSILLEFDDAAHRRPEYSKPFNLFGDPIPQETAIIDSVQKAIFHTLEPLSFCELYWPLGIGWHVDHLIAFECAFAMKDAFGQSRLFFYEDLPYRLFPNVRSERLRELHLAAQPHENMTSLLRLSALPTFRPFNRWALRPLLWLVFSIFFFRKFKQRRNRHGTAESAQHLELTNLDIASVLELKIQAMMLYPSQWREFFHSPNHFKSLAQDREVRCYEYYWSAIGSPPNSVTPDNCQ